MGDLVTGDDGLPAEVVGAWAKTKHEYLRRYVDITRGVRARWVEPDKAGATYIDPFCGPGRANVRNTPDFIDGSAVAAWTKSVECNVPFSKIFIADADPVCVAACEKRLLALGAPVVSAVGNAADTTANFVSKLDPSGLHFVFLDPYNLESLNFGIIRSFAALARVDILVHVSQMDLQRNLDNHAAGKTEAFDSFIPGWREVIGREQGKLATRQAILKYWSDLVAALGVWPSPDPKLVTGSKGQPLYWLLIVAKHDLALQFWKVAANKDKQGSFPF